MKLSTIPLLRIKLHDLTDNQVKKIILKATDKQSYWYDNDENYFNHTVMTTMKIIFKKWLLHIKLQYIS